MNTRRTERIAGALFILATASSSLGFILLDPILDDADVLASVAASENSVILGAVLLLIDAIAVVAIPVLLYPTFKKYNPHSLASTPAHGSSNPSYSSSGSSGCSQQSR